MRDDGYELEALDRELRELFARVEPVPAHVMDQAYSAFAWRGVAASLAGLEYDSIIDDDGLARLRTGGGERLLRFRSGGSMVEVSIVDEGHRLVGQITPPEYGRVEMRRPDQVREALVDEAGRFLVDDPAPGAMSLRCLPAAPGGAVLETEWVTI